jgi:hypothetical protein
MVWVVYITEHLNDGTLDQGRRHRTHDEGCGMVRRVCTIAACAAAGGLKLHERIPTTQ